MSTSPQLDLLPVQTPGQVPAASVGGGMGAQGGAGRKHTHRVLTGTAPKNSQKIFPNPRAVEALRGDPLLTAAPWLVWADSVAFEFTEIEYLEALEQTRLAKGIEETEFYAQVCREDLYFLAKYVLCDKSANENKLLWRYHKPAADLASDPRYPRQMWLEPRGWLKSTLKTEAKIIQRIIRNPDTAIFLWSEIERLSSDWLEKIKGHFLGNARFRQLFPAFCPPLGAHEFGNKTEFTVPNRKVNRLEPTLRAVSPGMELKGNHPDENFFDDLIGKESSKNRDRIRVAEQAFRDSFAMLPDKERGPTQVIGTRWNFGDVHQVIADELALENGGDFLCCITDCELPDGSPSVPELDNAASLASAKRTLEGSYYAVMRQQPIADDEGVAPEDIGDHEDTVEDLRRCNLYILCDSALAVTQRSDFSAVGVVAATPDGFLDVVEYTRGRVDPHEFMETVWGYWGRYKALGLPILGIGLQQAVLDRVLAFFINQRAKADHEFLPWHPVRIAGIAKVARMRRLIPLAKNGKLRLRKDAMPELRDELVRLPEPKPHDDLCDMLSEFADVVKWPDQTARRAVAPAAARPLTGLPLTAAGMYEAMKAERMARVNHNNRHPALRRPTDIIGLAA